MKSFSEYLEEAKNVGILYHFTSLNAAKEIIKSNLLKSFMEDLSISFTRDKNIYRRGAGYTISASTDRITIDGHKLSHKYKIQPYHDLEYFKNRTAKDYSDEMEERVYKAEIPSIRDYMLKVDVVKFDGRRGWVEQLKDTCEEYQIPFSDVNG